MGDCPSKAKINSDSPIEAGTDPDAKFAPIFVGLTDYCDIMILLQQPSFAEDTVIL